MAKQTFEQAMKKLEMTPHVIYRDVGSNSDTGFGIGLVYNFYKKLSLRVRGKKQTVMEGTTLEITLPRKVTA